jgi:hypothetical protein
MIIERSHIAVEDESGGRSRARFKFHGLLESALLLTTCLRKKALVLLFRSAEPASTYISPEYMPITVPSSRTSDKVGIGLQHDFTGDKIPAGTQNRFRTHALLGSQFKV